MTRNLCVYRIDYFSRRCMLSFAYILFVLSFLTSSQVAAATSNAVEVIYACADPAKYPWDVKDRAHIASCLGWQANANEGMCQGHYKQALRKSSTPEDSASKMIEVRANEVSLTSKGRSKLEGEVEVVHQDQILTATTAYIYRDAKSNQVTSIELLDDVTYSEPGRAMLAKQVHFDPQNKTGELHHVLYRFSHARKENLLPAYGKADYVERKKNRDVLLRGATFTTCSPKDNAWMLKAKTLEIYDDEARGVARDAVLEVKDIPLIYTPYLTFPTTKDRKSGFLMPTTGYSNIGGGDLSFPYYLNLAPNYDATLVPRVYTRRGFMLEGDTRFMTEHTKGVVGASFLPSDRAFGNYIDAHQASYPELRNLSTDRWSVFARGNVDFNDRLHLNYNYQKISDDYFLQDFSNNMTVMTESQLLQEASLSYTGDHWFARAMAQSYQTINPINQSPVDYIYQRLPQVQIRGEYDELPLDLNFWVRAQYDQFRWPVIDITQLEGPRVHVNPALFWELRKPWGYVKPEVQLVQNNYNLDSDDGLNSAHINHTIPRYSVDAGLTFERPFTWDDSAYTQTLEPRLYYLYVPYQNQSNYPAFDSAYMIFRYDQLFRNNRFSGFDRISDANQLAYAVRTRLLSSEDGKEKMSFAIGQLGYFANRKVQLCFAEDGDCTDDSTSLGYTSSEAKTSPITTLFGLRLTRTMKLDAGYAFDPYQGATNNADLNFYYEPSINHIFKFSYTYLVAANIIEEPDGSNTLTAEHQATVALAWPFSDRWSTIAIYSYNISAGYDMVSFLGLQYDSCCWAVRAFAGRAYNSLNLDLVDSVYNNSVYVQFLLKGLGAVSTNDPASTIRTYLPTYQDVFHKP